MESAQSLTTKQQAIAPIAARLDEIWPGPHYVGSRIAGPKSRYRQPSDAGA